MASLKGAYNGLKGPRSRSVLLYLLFVVISTALWCIVTFNNAITVDMDIPVKITAPSNVHFLDSKPATVTVSVSSRGSSFVKYLFMSAPTLELKFDDYNDDSGLFRVEPAQLKKALNTLFQGTATINSALPGEISLRYTDQVGKKVPVIIEQDIQLASAYALAGEIKQNYDSVLVYGDRKTLQGITEVHTFLVKEVGLTDTLCRKVKLEPHAGAVFEPNYVEIMIPVEKMIQKSIKIPISVRNVPQDVNVVVFPSTVDVSFRVPMSYYKNNANAVTAVVDYNSININTPGNKVELRVGEVPGAYKDVILSLDSVEYIIEKH